MNPALPDTGKWKVFAGRRMWSAWLFAALRTPLVVLLPLISTPALAYQNSDGCSPTTSYYGKLRLNEAKSQGGGSGLDYLELYTIDNNVDLSNYKIGISDYSGGLPNGWVPIAGSNPKAATMALPSGYGCVDYSGSNSGFSSCTPKDGTAGGGTTWGYGRYILFDLPNMDSNKGQVVLLDKDGKIIDFLAYTSSASCNTTEYWTPPTEGSACYNVANCATGVSASNSDLARSSDGTGTWQANGSSSGTQGTTNAGAAAPTGGVGYKFQFAATCSGSTPAVQVTAVWVDVNGAFVSNNPTYTAASGTINISTNPANITGNSGTLVNGVAVVALSGTTSIAPGATFTITAVNPALPGTGTGPSGLLTVPACVSLDHFSLSASASSVANCDDVDITVSAHDASHNAVGIPAATAITLTATRTGGTETSNRGDWTTTLSSGSGTLDNGTADDGVAIVTTGAAQSSFTARFRDTWTQNMEFTASAAGVTGTTPSGEKPAVAFSPSAFRFVDAASAALDVAFKPTAGQTSASVYLQAVNSASCSGGSCPGVCTLLFPPGLSTPIGLAYECVSPGACQSGQTLNINGMAPGITGNASGAAIVYSTVNLQFNANNGAGKPANAAPLTLNYSDVGNIRLWASSSSGVPPANYSGTFRVIPFDFKVTSGAVTSACGSFVFMGDTTAIQPSPAVIVNAVNSSNAITPNYRSGYATNLAAATLIAQDSGGGPVTLDAPVPNCLAANWDTSGCSLGTTWTTAINRPSASAPSAAIKPVNFKVNIADPNADVSLCASPAGCIRDIGSATDAYYGRLRLNNAFGSEMLALTVPLFTEYYDGTWRTATATPVIDSCTRIPVPTIGSGLTLSLAASGTTAATLANGTAAGSVAAGSGTFYQGDGRLILSAPGGNHTGYVDVGLAAPSWLLFTGIANNTTARATFGIYNQLGNSRRIIYRREVR